MTELFFLIFVIFGSGAISSAVFHSNNRLANFLGSGLAIAGSLAGMIFSILLLLNRTPLSLNIPTQFPLLNLSVSVDLLSGFFFLVISTVAFFCSVYSIGYMKHYFGKYDLGVYGFFYNIFIASLLLVVAASNGLFFLVAWELMALSSYFLVIYEHQNTENIRAGLLYFVMTHFGTLFIILVFLTLYSVTGSFDFQVIQSVNKFIPDVIKNMIFICALIGFGTKAGIIPLHIWLPRAHPAAPSPVSALMSGVMIKTAIYMMIRLFLGMFVGEPIWWGGVILILGASSSVLGVLYALAEHDIKRLLAYHSVENIGIILLGLGSSMVFLSLGFPALATLSLIASLYHTMNHAVFKSLLFLSAGSVVAKMDTRNMEEYGGLIKKMPYTAFFFLIGAIAISGLPPFNGFVSEWLTFQSLLGGIFTQSIAIKVLFIISVASLAFTGGLAAACFVKAFGVSFLARPRSEEAEHARESSWLLQIGMVIPAVLTVLLAVFAGDISQGLKVLVGQLASFNSTPLTLAPSGIVQTEVSNAVLNIPLLFTAFVIGICITFLLVYLMARQQVRVLYETWACGQPGLEPNNEITATAFSRSLIVMFSGIFQPTKQHDIEYSDVNSRYFAISKSVTLHTPDLYEQKIYRPLQSALRFLAAQTARIQSGNINQYLLYIFLSLIILLIWVRYF